MSVKEIRQHSLVWVNISHVDEETIQFLRERYNFHPLDLADIQNESQTPKIDVYKNYLFLVLHFPQWRSESKKIDAHEVAIFVGDNFIITIQQGKNKEIKNFFYRCMNNRRIKSDWMSQNSGYILYRLLEALFAETRILLNNVGKQISDQENEIFSGTQDMSVFRILALHRRNVLRLRRMLDPQRYLMSNLSHIRQPFLDENLSIYFDNLKDYLDKLWSIVETYQETIKGLHITVESIINQRTNRIISTLTIISVASIPLNLLASMYGMNIAGLPFAQKPFGVLIIFAGISLITLLTIITIRRKKLL